MGDSCLVIWVCTSYRNLAIRMDVLEKGEKVSCPFRRGSTCVGGYRMNFLYFLFFFCFVIGTLIITYWAAKRSKTTIQLYTASGSLTGIQNGMAIAGDYISAASFLVIIGQIAIYGFDGFLYSLGFLVSYLIVLFLIAEPVHHLGKISLADVVCARFPSQHIRTIMAMGSL